MATATPCAHAINPLPVAQPLPPQPHPPPLSSLPLLHELPPLSLPGLVLDNPMGALTPVTPDGRVVLTCEAPTYDETDLEPFSHVLSLVEGDCHMTPAMQQAMQRGRKRYCTLSVADDASATLPLKTACNWIRMALESGPDARVLLHCREGCSRSASVAWAFLAVTEKLTGDAALERLQAARTCICVDRFAPQVRAFLGERCAVAAPDPARVAPPASVRVDGDAVLLCED